MNFAKIQFMSLLAVGLFLFMNGCGGAKKEMKRTNLRGLVDTVGFAHTAGQMDSLLQRITSRQSGELRAAEKNLPDGPVKLAVSPHDDYGYVGYLYPALYRKIKAPVVIIFGVAHKARKFNLQDRIIFDSYDAWQGPFGPIGVSPLREQIIKALPEDSYVVHDSMQAVEHSVEALLPFLQYYNRRVEFVPILVPYMSFQRMSDIAPYLAGALAGIMEEKKWRWGEDLALLVSNDAVHYGDAGWSGKNFAYFGADQAGYDKAVRYEQEIIANCLTGPLESEKVKLFTEYTVRKEDYKEYKYTWCGRYSLPFGLLTAFFLQKSSDHSCQGHLLGYATSIDHDKLPVEDLGMGFTAPASLRHWVGYAAVAWD